MLELDALSLADPSFGGIHNIVCKSRCVRIGMHCPSLIHLLVASITQAVSLDVLLQLNALSLADPCFGYVHNVVCKSECVGIGCIVAH